MLKKQLLVWIIIFCACKLHSQNIILVANGGGLYSLDINSVSCTTQLISNYGCGGSILSAALFKDTLYYVGFDATTSAYTLFQSVLNNNSYCKKFRIYNIPNNLTVDSAGIVYWIDSEVNELFSLNPHSGALTTLGQIAFASSGDLIFYNSKLYLAAAEGLVEINVQNPESSKVYMSTGDHSFFGLINIPVGCNKDQVFGIETKETGESSLIEIDMENKKIGSVFCTIPFDVFDAASITETGIVKGISVASLEVHPDCGINGHSGSINVNAVSASPGAISIFLNGKVTDNTGVFQNLSAGNYSFHIVSSDGCATDTIINIAQSSKLNYSLKILSDTCNAGKGIIYINSLGNFGTLTYYLNDKIQMSNIYTNLQTNIYKISVEDENKCRLDSNVSISNTTLSSPISFIDITGTTCEQNSGKINIHTNTSLPVKFSLNNATPQTSGLFTGLDTGIYKLQTFESYCQFDTTVKISAKPIVKPIITFNTTSPTCFNKQDASLKVNVFNAAAPFNTSLDNGALSNTTYFLNLNAGSHAIKIVDANTCTWDTSAIISAYKPIKPQVNYTVKNPQCGQSLLGTVTAFITGLESPYSFFINNNRYNSGSKAGNLLPGNYSIKILNKTNCEVDSLNVSLVAENNGFNCDTIYVPSAFTPNNDGLNDVLKPVISGFPSEILFQVFNRYGQKIFSTTKLNAGWNGMYNQIPQSSGTYVWTCIYSTTTGIKKFANGTVILIK